MPQLEDFFKGNIFRTNSVNTKTFVLMLAQASPRNFISGNVIGLAAVLRDYNRSEFHHLYPKTFLSQQGVDPDRQGVFANFCFLSKSDNNQLSGDAPSVYRTKLPEDPSAILKAALCPESLFVDDYENFLDERTALLVQMAESLTS